MEIVNDDKQDKVRIVNVCKDSEWSNREVGDVGKTKWIGVDNWNDIAVCFIFIFWYFLFLTEILRGEKEPFFVFHTSWDNF